MVGKVLQQYKYQLYLQKTKCNMLYRTKTYGNSVVNEQKKVLSIADRTLDPETIKTKIRITPQEEQAPVKGQVHNSRLPSLLCKCPLFDLYKVPFPSEIVRESF